VNIFSIVLLMGIGIIQDQLLEFPPAPYPTDPLLFECANLTGWNINIGASRLPFYGNDIDSVIGLDLYYQRNVYPHPQPTDATIEKCARLLQSGAEAYEDNLPESLRARSGLRVYSWKLTVNGTLVAYKKLGEPWRLVDLRSGGKDPEKKR
jgi:hypothetical protein